MDKESNKSLKKTKCRVCKGATSNRSFFYKCLSKKCNSSFWHGKVTESFNHKLKPNDLENIQIEENLLKKAGVPRVMNDKKTNVYVILLSKEKGKKKDSVYVGKTNNHPHRRYLQHLRLYNPAKIIKKGLKPKAILFTEMGYEPEVACEREKALAKELESQYIVYGGH